MPGDLTRLLERWGNGDREAVTELIPLVYNELYVLARGYLRHERPGHTLQCSALVHETYLRLVQMDGVRWQNRAQFFSISAQAVRQNLSRISLRSGDASRHSGEA